ncbi:hypothetical protein ACFU53_23815 [Streptomyces sp. NPDC057474]|uniref:hypothetical protein n=1 Tax=Streptomyces sp. NPDC057474 TaxID=3346144 RepID=UPI003697C7FF
MTEQLGAGPPLRTKEEVRTFVLELKAEAKRLAADVGDLSRPMAAGEALVRAVAIQQKWDRVRDWAIEQEVQDVTVPDYPPGGPVSPTAFSAPRRCPLQV